MKKSRKILKIVFIVLILISMWLFISNNAFAWDIEGKLDSFNDADAGKSGETVEKVMGSVIKLISTVGAGVAVIMLVVIGIQYVTKGAEGRAEAKKDLTGYLIGAVILFGISGILRLLNMFIDANINNASMNNVK